MQYRLFVYNNKKEDFDAKGSYKTRKIAESKSKQYIKKDRDIKITLIPTSELKIGMKVYGSDGDLYGDIIDESESFWFIKRSFIEDEDDRMFFLKSDFIEKYENGIFTMKEELDGCNVL